MELSYQLFTYLWVLALRQPRPRYQKVWHPAMMTCRQGRADLTYRTASPAVSGSRLSSFLKVNRPIGKISCHKIATWIFSLIPKPSKLPLVIMCPFIANNVWLGESFHQWGYSAVLHRLGFFRMSLEDLLWFSCLWHSFGYLWDNLLPKGLKYYLLIN